MNSILTPQTDEDRWAADFIEQVYRAHMLDDAGKRMKRIEALHKELAAVKCKADAADRAAGK